MSSNDRSPEPGALMLAEAASAHAAVRAQLAAPRFAQLGARLRALKPRVVVTCARGSSDHAATFAKYLIETRLGVVTASAAPSVASLYEVSPSLDGALFLLISQSGASPDLIATAQAARRAGALIVALVNDTESPATAIAHEVLPLEAGPERSVAATKSFIASLAAICGLVAHWAEDRELTAWFLVDLSASVDFGSDELSKRRVAAEFVAVLARLLTRHGNRVGALLYGNEVDTVIPARGGRIHVLNLLQRMNARPEQSAPGATNLRDLLIAGQRIVKRRSTVFVVSDFISAPGWETALAQLARRHEVTAVRLFDPLEMDLPDIGLLTLRDAETGEQLLVDTHDRGFRARFKAAAERREAALLDGLAGAGVDTLELATDDDLMDAILRFAELRKQRSRLANWSGKPSRAGAFEHLVASGSGTR